MCSGVACAIKTAEVFIKYSDVLIKFNSHASQELTLASGTTHLSAYNLLLSLSWSHL